MSLITIAPWFTIALAVFGAIGWIGSLVGGQAARNAIPSEVTLPAAPRSGHYLIFLGGFAAFALYGSLVPFQFKALGFAEALRIFAGILRRDIAIESRSDWLSNVLLALPLGYCATGALAVDRRGMTQYGGQLPLVMLGCTCFAAGLEFAQLWVPARTCSQNDIAAQAIGSAIGCAMWVIAGQRTTNWVRQLISAPSPQWRKHRLAQLYCLILFVYSVLPFDLSISPVEIYHKLHRGMVLFQPITADEFSKDRISETLTQVVMFATLGILVVGENLEVGLRRVLFRAFSWGLCLAMSIECAQLFVLSRYSKVSDVVLGAAAAVAGAMVYFLVFNSGNRSSSRGVSRRQSAWRWFAMAGLYAVMITVIYTAPFEWLQSEARIAKRWHNLWNIPFGYSKYWSDPLEALADVMSKIILFASLGAFLAKGFEPVLSGEMAGAKFRRLSPANLREKVVGNIEYLHRDKLLHRDEASATANRACRQCRGLVYLLAVSLIAAFSLLIEMLQVHLPPHVADVTDVLVAAFGGWLGVAAALRF
jgi:VanZ family protein